MLGGVKEVNYFIAFEITLMQRAMIQASYYHAHSCDIIVINTRPRLRTRVITMISHSWHDITITYIYLLYFTWADQRVQPFYNYHIV